MPVNQDESPVYEGKRELDLRLTTFNLLAPCYKRIHNDVPIAAMAAAGSGTGLLASQARKHHTPRESEFDVLWEQRAIQTVSEGFIFSASIRYLSKYSENIL